MKKTLQTALLCLLPVVAFAQQKFTIIPSVGYAWRTASLPSNLDARNRDYFKQLKSGVNIDVAAYYRLKTNLGLGVKYNLYSSSATGTVYGYDPQTNQPVSVNLQTDDKITFVGPSLMYSNFEDARKHKLYYDLALGVISYTTKSPGSEITGSNLGLALTVGYMYQLTPMILVGPQLSYTGGTLKKFNINGVEYTAQEGEYEALHRVALSAGATFRF